jgi:hypothetical protein
VAGDIGKYSDTNPTFIRLTFMDHVLANNPAGAIYSGYYLMKRFGITE